MPLPPVLFAVFFFFNDTATTEIYTNRSSAASDVYKRQRVACRLAAEVLEMIAPFVQPGVSTGELDRICHESVSYTHLRAHETVLDLVCRLLLEKKKPSV